MKKRKAMGLTTNNIKVQGVFMDFFNDLVPKKNFVLINK